MLVVVLHNPAIPVAAVGVAVVGIRLAARAEQPRRVLNVLGVPVLVGLFGVAVALGTLGRVWSGPATLMSHLDLWGTAGEAPHVACVAFDHGRTTGPAPKISVTVVLEAFSAAVMRFLLSGICQSLRRRSSMKASASS